MAANPAESRKKSAGRLGPLGSDAPIGVAEMDPAAASLPGNAFARARAESRTRIQRRPL